MSRNRENFSIETDLLIGEYNTVPLAELEETGIFSNAGPLLAIQLMRKLRSVIEDENIHPRHLTCSAFRLPAKRVMFMGHTPTFDSKEDIRWMYDEIINEATREGVNSITLPILGATSGFRKKFSPKVLTEIFREKMAELLQTTTMKIIVTVTEGLNSDKIIEELSKTWETLDQRKTRTRRKKTTPTRKRVNNVGDRLVKFGAKLNGKPGIALMDPGSEVCIVEKRWLKSLQEGRDYNLSLIHI